MLRAAQLIRCSRLRRAVRLSQVVKSSRRAAAAERQPLGVWVMENLVVLVAAVLLTCVIGWLLFCDRLAPGEPRNDIEDRAQRLGAMFEELEDFGYDTAKPLQWKYVFMHREYEPLARLARHLREEGYELVATEEIREPEHSIVEHKIVLARQERHSEETLAVRNLELRQLASTFGIDLYDGSWVLDPDENLELADA